MRGHGAPLSSRHHTRNGESIFSRAIPFEQLVASDDMVSQYLTLLERQQLLDSQLAVRLSIADWRSVLPDAPVGHCVRINELAERSSYREPVLPERGDWRFVAKLLSTTSDNDEHVLEYSFRNFESLMLISSLLLIVCVDQMMQLPCADHHPDAEAWANSTSACESTTMVRADFIAWLAAFAFLFACMYTAFVMHCYTGMFLTAAEAPKFAYDNWTIINSPVGFFMNGTFFLFFAVPVRLTLLWGSHYAHGLATFALVLVGFLFVWFFRFLSRLLGLTLAGTVRAFMANLGILDRAHPPPELWPERKVDGAARGGGGAAGGSGTSSEVVVARRVMPLPLPPWQQQG